MIKTLGLIVLSAALVSGCSSRLQLPDSKSGFLKDYHLFKPNPQNENSWVRTRHGVTLDDLTKYDSIALAPIELWLGKNKAVQIKDKSKQQRLTQYFEQQIKAKVGNKYQIVPPGTKGSLLIRMALTNLEEKSPEMEMLDILPFRIVMNASESAYRLAAAKKAVIGNASLEAEFVDTDSGQGLIAIIAKNSSGEVNVDDTPDNVDSIKLVFDDWVNNLAKALSTKVATPSP